jgi:hypothetical protein
MSSKLRVCLRMPFNSRLSPRVGGRAGEGSGRALDGGAQGGVLLLGEVRVEPGSGRPRNTAGRLGDLVKSGKTSISSPRQTSVGSQLSSNQVTAGQAGDESTECH